MPIRTEIADSRDGGCLPARTCFSKLGAVLRLAFGLAFLQSFASPAAAAKISVASAGPKEVALVFIMGPIREGDSREFIHATEKVQRALVALSSPGGSLAEALAIGAEIRIRNFATSVGDECSSACALIWLSGARRYFNEGAKLGFHAASVSQNGTPQEAAAGNAEIGSFMTHLGLSAEAITFVTSAPPDQMRWLTLDDARRLGISIVGHVTLEEAQRLADQHSRAEERSRTSKKAEAKLKITEREPGPAEMYSLAAAASDLVAAGMCGTAFNVDLEQAEAAHKRLMDMGAKYGERFIDVLYARLSENARRMKRDGTRPYCEGQKKRFLEAGLSWVYKD